MEGRMNTNDGIVIVRILFCGSVLAAREFPGKDKALEWANKVVGMGRMEPDGPQFEVEYSM